MKVSGANLKNWSLTRSGSATAVVTEKTFNYSGSASTKATLEKPFWLNAGQTLTISMTHNTTWSRPRIEMVLEETNTTLNLIDLDGLSGWQEVSLTYTMPWNQSGNVVVRFGSVDGLNAAGQVTDVSVVVSDMEARRVAAYGVIKIANGVVTLDGNYSNMGVESVALSPNDTITVTLGESWNASAKGFTRPVTTANRIVGGGLTDGVIEFLEGYGVKNTITILGQSLTQDSLTKDIAFGYVDFSDKTMNISFSVIK